MNKAMTCIECPLGCSLNADIDNGRVIKVSGNKCPKGEAYALNEVQDPRRILTSTVLCEGLDLKFLPVRTDIPVAKSSLTDLMREIRTIHLKIPLKAGDIVKANILGSGANLIATRSTKSKNTQDF